jgi:hypothetical protein
MSWARPSSTKAIAVLVKSGKAGYLFYDSELLADLERMAPQNEAARKLLYKLASGILGDKDKETAHKAHRILASLDLPADQVLKSWTKALSHADSNVRNDAIGALTRLGPSAKSAKPALRERFTEETDFGCKEGILDALLAIDPDDPALVPLLIKEALDAPGSRVSDRAKRGLKALGAKAKAAFPKIEARLLGPKANSDDLFFRR